jgi:hypothetical protein
MLNVVGYIHPILLDRAALPSTRVPRRCRNEQDASPRTGGRSCTPTSRQCGETRRLREKVDWYKFCRSCSRPRPSPRTTARARSRRPSVCFIPCIPADTFSWISCSVHDSRLPKLTSLLLAITCSSSRRSVRPTRLHLLRSTRLTMNTRRALKPSLADTRYACHTTQHVPVVS